MLKLLMFVPLTMLFTEQIEFDQKLIIISKMENIVKGDFHQSYLRKEILSKSIYGLGTFPNLNGELIVVNGEAYRGGEKGRVTAISDDLRPTFFIGVKISPNAKSRDIKLSYEDVIRLSSSDSKPKAIVLKGVFETFVVRTVSSKGGKFRNLSDGVKNQETFEHKKVSGTLVGFYFPRKYRSLTGEGFHAHFISSDREIGGHVLGFSEFSGELIEQEISMPNIAN